MTDADRFVDLACLTYAGDDSPARRAKAEELLRAQPAIVDASVHAAAAAGDVDALRAWLDRDPSLINPPGGPRSWAPLLSLCYSRVQQVDALACLELLLARGADPNAHVMLGPCKFTALTGVMGEGEAGPVAQPPHALARAIAERLLDAGADPNEAQGLYNTHFLPSTEWLELLLARGMKSELDFLLGQAAQQGFAERVQLLVAHGASPDGRNHYNRRTHLENARLEGHVDIARMLEDAGARPVRLAGIDAFRAACLRGDEGEARRVIAAYPEVSREVARDAGTLTAAARHGHLAAVKLALSFGVSIDAVDREGLTALHHAARAGHPDVVRELIAAGASLAIRDPQYGGAPVGHAAYFAEHWPSPGRDEALALLRAAASG